MQFKTSAQLPSRAHTTRSVCLALPLGQCCESHYGLADIGANPRLVPSSSPDHDAQHWGSRSSTCRWERDGWTVPLPPREQGHERVPSAYRYPRRTSTAHSAFAALTRFRQLPSRALGPDMAAVTTRRFLAGTPIGAGGSTNDCSSEVALRPARVYNPLLGSH